MTSRLRDSIRRFPTAFAVAALALLAVGVFWPLLFGGRAFFLGDLELYFYPLSEFWHRELGQGRLPLWNPYLFGGVPFAGNPQIGLLYPPSVLLAIFPTITAISMGLVLHLWGSAVVFFCWLRRGRLQLGAMASLLGAVCWMLGGAFVSKTQFPNMLAALAWMPAVLWATENLAKRPRARAAVLLGTVLGLQLMAAHAQVSLYTLYMAFFYALWVRRNTASRSPIWKTGAAFFGACLLAVLLDAGQILPVLENLRGAERQVLSLQTAPRFVLPPWAITNLFAPYLYGNPNDGTWTFHGGGNAWETACFIGVVPFLLALSALKRARFWRWVALTSVLLALGPLGGLYSIAFLVLPGMARFHDAARFLMLAGVALPIMAALGLQTVHDRPKTRRWAPLLLLLCVPELGSYAHGFYPLRAKEQVPPPASFAGANDTHLKTSQARIWCGNPKTARGLLIDYHDYRLCSASHDAVFPPNAIPNTHIWSGLMEAGGYDPIAPAVVTARLKELEIADGATRFPNDYAVRLGENNIRLVSIWRQKPLLASPGLVEIYRGSQKLDGMRLFVYRNDICLPRARWRSAAGNWSAASIKAESANSVEIEVPVAATQIALADNFAPGWTASETGRPLQLRATPIGFRQVDLKAAGGSSPRQIRFDFVPNSWRFGVFLSLCGLGFVVAAWVATSASSAGNRP